MSENKTDYLLKLFLTMNAALKFLILSVSLLFTTGLYASSIPWEIEVLEASDTSLNLDWEDVEGVLWYYIYYGESSWSGADYDVEGVDLIEESNFLLTDLKAETRYFIAVSSVDEFWSESAYSPELEYETSKAWTVLSAASFRVVEAQAIDDKSIEIKFSVDLESWLDVQRQFIIENLATSEELSVDVSDLVPGDPTSVVAVLGWTLLANTQYKVTALEIRDIDGNTIESGIDAFVNFTTPIAFSSDLESAWTSDPVTTDNTETEGNTSSWSQNDQTSPSITDPINQQEDQNQDLNSAWALQWNNAGTTISTSDNTSQAAKDNEKLPQTGPEHILLAMFALIFWAGIFYARWSRKES